MEATGIQIVVVPTTMILLQAPGRTLMMEAITLPVIPVPLTEEIQVEIGNRG